MTVNEPQPDGVGQNELHSILIRKGCSDINKPSFDDKTSLAASLARARGGGGVSEITSQPSVRETKLSETTSQLSPKESDFPGQITAYAVDFITNNVTSETGYYMTFVPEKYRNAHPFDIMSIPRLPTHPVPKSAVDNLPMKIRRRFKDEEYFKLTAAYNWDQERFFGVSLGWGAESSEQDLVDLFMELLKQGLSVTQAADFLIWDQGGLSVEEIAELREVRRDSIKKNINRAKRDRMRD